MRWLAAILFLLLCSEVEAATCFWVGGTGIWDNSTDTANWKSTSGGGTACAATGGVPKNAGDIATFDGASGGGTVTVNVNINIAQITMGAFTGTLDFSANNNNVTLTTAFSGTGSGTRTLNMGNGIWTLSATSGTVFTLATTTGLTFNANSSTILFSATTSTARTFAAGNVTYNTISVAANTGGGSLAITGAPTSFTTLNVTAPNYIILSNGVSYPVTNAINVTGSSSNQVGFASNSTGNQATLSSANNATFTWSAFKDIATAGGGTFTATNSFNLGNNSGITITPPSTGGGGRIIGGWLLRRDLYHDNDNNPAWLEKAG